MQIYAFVLLFLNFCSASPEPCNCEKAATETLETDDTFETRTISGGSWGVHSAGFDSLSTLDKLHIFTNDWFNQPAVAKTFKANIAKKQIMSNKVLLENTEFVREWIAKAAETLQPRHINLVKKKTQDFLILLQKYRLEHAVLPPAPGAECLWSGHVENSNYARYKDGRTPLETPKLMEVLSATFGTEHFKKGTANDGFSARWLPNICPMFNAATVIYSTMMKPTGGVVPVYANQLKQGSAFFDAEIPLILKKGNVQHIKFIILSPPTGVPPPAGVSPPPEIKKVAEITVQVKANAKATQEAVIQAFQDLDTKTVTILWNNKFDVAVNSNKQKCNGEFESHPFDNPSKGTRKLGKKAKCIYENFFKHYKDARVSASLISDRFELQPFIASLLLFCVILLSFYKYVLRPKSELNIIFNTEPSSHFTEFAQI